MLKGFRSIGPMTNPSQANRSRCGHSVSPANPVKIQSFGLLNLPNPPLPQLKIKIIHMSTVGRGPPSPADAAPNHGPLVGRGHVPRRCRALYQCPTVRRCSAFYLPQCPDIKHPMGCVTGTPVRYGSFGETPAETMRRNFRPPARPGNRRLPRHRIHLVESRKQRSLGQFALGSTIRPVGIEPTAFCSGGRHSIR